MELDLSKFGALAAEAEPEHQSELYQQLTRAFDTIYDLSVNKKIKRAKVIVMLQQSGLTELDEQRMNTWWNSTIIKKKRDDLKNQLEREAETKARTKEAWGREAETSLKVNQQQTAETLQGKVKPKQPAVKEPEVSTQDSEAVEEPQLSARMKRAQIPGKSTKGPSDNVATVANGGRQPVKVEGDLVVPWTTFLTHVKKKHNWNAGVISAALQDKGILNKENGKFSLVEDAPDLIVGFGAGDQLLFGQVQVYMNALTLVIEQHLGITA